MYKSSEREIMTWAQVCQCYTNHQQHISGLNMLTLDRIIPEVSIVLLLSWKAVKRWITG